MVKILNVRDLRGKGEMELQIPGFPDYTIDTDLTVRSYLRYELHVMKHEKGKGVQLRRDGKKHYVTPAKLLFCAQRNIDPLQVDGRKFMILTDGKVVERANLRGIAGTVDVNLLPNKGFKSRKAALRQVRMLYQGLLAQKKTLAQNDPRYIAEYLAKYKKPVLTVVVSYGNNIKYVKEIEARYGEFAELIGKKFLDNNLVKAGLHASAARMMLNLLKEEKENPKKTDYAKVEYAMTESGMYKQ